jgi:hypothetical protein
MTSMGQALNLEVSPCFIMFTLLERWEYQAETVCERLSIRTGIFGPAMELLLDKKNEARGENLTDWPRCHKTCLISSPHYQIPKANASQVPIQNFTDTCIFK